MPSRLKAPAVHEISVRCGLTAPSHEARQAATRTAPILPGHRHPAPGLRRASRARFAPAAWSCFVGITVRARRRMFSCAETTSLPSRLKFAH